MSPAHGTGQRCQRSMRQRVPQFTRAILSQISDCGPTGGPPPQAHQWIADSIGRALDAVPLPPADILATLNVPRMTGERCARHGIPADALKRVYDIGGRVLSTAFMHWAIEEGLGSHESALLMDRLWDIVDKHTAAALGALGSAQDGVPDQRSAGYLIDALLNGDDRAATVTAVARAFGLPEQGRYAVIARAPVGGAPAVPADALIPHVQGMRVLWRAHGDAVIGTVVLGEGSPALLTGSLPGPQEYQVGISAAVTGLAALGQARKQAESAIRTLRGAGVALHGERLHAVMLNSCPNLARELQSQVLAPVLALNEGRRDVLLGTLEAWLAADGSVAEVATSLRCHRNTVLNRLRQIEQLTGRSLSVPRHVIDLGLASEAFRLFDAHNYPAHSVPPHNYQRRF